MVVTFFCYVAVIGGFLLRRHDVRNIIVCSGYLENDIFTADTDATHHCLAKPFPVGTLATLAVRLIGPRTSHVA